MIVKKERDVGVFLLIIEWSVSQEQVPGCIYAKNAVEDVMRISVNCCWKKTCNQQNKGIFSMGKVEYFLYLYIFSPLPWY